MLMVYIRGVGFEWTSCINDLSRGRKSYRKGLVILVRRESEIYGVKERYL